MKFSQLPISVSKYLHNIILHVANLISQGSGNFLVRNYLIPTRYSDILNL